MLLWAAKIDTSNFLKFDAYVCLLRMFLLAECSSANMVQLRLTEVDIILKINF